jgi:hypothetical protein
MYCNHGCELCDAGGNTVVRERRKPMSVSYTLPRVIVVGHWTRGFLPVPGSNIFNGNLWSQSARRRLDRSKGYRIIFRYQNGRPIFIYCNFAVERWIVDGSELQHTGEVGRKN